MKRLLLIMILFTTYLVPAQTMEFDSQIIDYGTIEQNSNGKREFKFTNTGDKELIIKSVKGSCGCTIPSHKKEDGSIEWSSGETGIIKVRYATNRIGKFIKNITVTTNIPGDKPIILTIKGKVIKNK